MIREQIDRWPILGRFQDFFALQQFSAEQLAATARRLWPAGHAHCLSFCENFADMAGLPPNPA
jgi:hypothetical protein